MSRVSCRPANGRTRTARTAIRPRLYCRGSVANCRCWTRVERARAGRSGIQADAKVSASRTVTVEAAGARLAMLVQAAAFPAIWTTRYLSDGRMVGGNRTLPTASRGDQRLDPVRNELHRQRRQYYAEQSGED